MSVSNPNEPVSSGAAIEDKSLDKESVIELLGEDDKEQVLELEEPKKEKPKEKVEKESEEEEDEEKELTLEEELEQELEEPKEEDELEILEPPRRKEILAKYPQLFKDFPQLERAMYREQRYAELLPTIEDAKSAVEKSQILDQYETEIMSGSTESLLNSVKDNDKEAFAKVVDNYLPTLFKVDQHSYYHTIGNIIKHTIASMVRDGKEQNSDELGEAAAILNHYIFGTTQYTPPQKLSKEEVEDNQSKEKQKELSRKEIEFVERQYNTALDGLTTKVDNILKATVDKAIDPNDSMTEYVRKNAIREVLEGLEEAIQKDTRFKAIYDRLWERAFDSNFNKESMDRIESAYKSKAKTLLPLLIKRARNEALRGSNRKSNDEKDRKGPLPVGKTRSSTTLASGSANKGSSSKPAVPKGMSTLDFLNSDD